MQTHIAIAGDGPAALFLGVACAEAGLDVVISGPGIDLPWTNRYGAWADELDGLGLRSAYADVFDQTDAWMGEGEHRRLDRGYVRLDSDRLQWLLMDRFNDAGGILVGAAVEAIRPAPGGARVELDNGDTLRSTVAVDATGGRSYLTERRGKARSFQTAYGIECTLTGEQPWARDAMTLMDFRSPAGEPGPNDVPTFLYAMPLENGRWFLEETVLTRGPMVPPDQLHERLQRRLAALGNTIVDASGQERCVIAMDLPRPIEGQGHVAWGAAASMIHPATGYSLAYVANRAPVVAAVLAHELRRPGSDTPRRALAAAQDAVWSADDLRTDELYRFGASTLANADLVRYRRFFGAFFELPEEVWRGYLSRTLSPTQLRNAMLGLFARLNPGLQASLASHVVRQPGRVLRGLLPDPRRMWRSSQRKGQGQGLL